MPQFICDRTFGNLLTQSLQVERMIERLVIYFQSLITINAIYSDADIFSPLLAMEGDQNSLWSGLVMSDSRKISVIL
jgi:hypothetical protein